MSYKRPLATFDDSEDDSAPSTSSLPRKQRVPYATPLDIPSSSSPSSIKRTSAYHFHDKPHREFLSQRFIPIIACIFEYCVSRSTHGDPYTIFFSQYTVNEIAVILLDYITQDSLALIVSPIKGEIPTSAMIEAMPQIHPTSDFNLPGVYLHFGTSFAPIFTLLYMGSTTSLTPVSYDGNLNLVGLLRRVFSEHCNPKHRREQTPPNAGPSHYTQMFNHDDTQDQHRFGMLAFAYPDQLNDLFARLDRDTSSASTTPMHKLRAAPIRILESLSIILCGFSNANSELKDIMHSKKLALHKLSKPMRSLNLTPDLEELAWDPVAHFARSSKGGLAASASRGMSLKHYNRATRGDEAAKEDSHRGGTNTGKKRRDAIVGIWTSGDLFQRDLNIANARPRFHISKSLATLGDLVPHRLVGTKDTHFFLEVPLDKMKNGKQIDFEDYPKPLKGKIFWQLSTGVLSQQGLPLPGEVCLKAWEATLVSEGSPSSLTASSIAYGGVRPYERAPGEQLCFSLANAVSWNTRASQGEFLGRKPRKNTFVWTHVERFEVFYAWLMNNWK